MCRIGLSLTTTIPVETSKMTALIVLIVLAAHAIVENRIPLLATRPGLYLSGLTAGIATGLASIGGMVVALYVLSQDQAARNMRGSLVMFLFIGMFTFDHLPDWFDVNDPTASCAPCFRAYCNCWRADWLMAFPPLPGRDLQALLPDPSDHPGIDWHGQNARLG